jgi:hypothetical protein
MSTSSWLAFMRLSSGEIEETGYSLARRLPSSRLRDFGGEGARLRKGERAARWPDSGNLRLCRKHDALSRPCRAALPSQAGERYLHIPRKMKDVFQGASERSVTASDRRGCRGALHAPAAAVPEPLSRVQGAGARSAPLRRSMFFHADFKRGRYLGLRRGASRRSGKLARHWAVQGRKIFRPYNEPPPLSGRVARPTDGGISECVDTLCQAGEGKAGGFTDVTAWRKSVSLAGEGRAGDFTDAAARRKSFAGVLPAFPGSFTLNRHGRTGWKSFSSN